MAEIIVKRTDPMTIAFLRVKGPYSGIPQAFDKLYGWASGRGHTPHGMPSTVYLTDPRQTPAADAVWEVWTPIEDAAVPFGPDEEGRGIRQVDEETVALAIHRGPYEGLDAVYRELGEWVAARGYDMTGAPREQYMSEPGVPPEEALTEVRFPIRER